MRFVVYAEDEPDALPRRLAAIDAHRAYLSEAPPRYGVEVLLSGPLVGDDGETMRGSFFLLEAADRSAVEAMFADDPLARADVWKKRSISAVFIRQNNMKAE